MNRDKSAILIFFDADDAELQLQKLSFFNKRRAKK